MKNLKHTEKLKVLCSEHIYLTLGFCSRHFALFVYHICLLIIRGNILTGVNRVDFEGEGRWFAVRYKFLFWTLYISSWHRYQLPPSPRVRLVLEGWSRVKAVSDSNSSMGTIFVLGTTQNLNFSKPPIVIIGFL